MKADPLHSLFDGYSKLQSQWFQTHPTDRLLPAQRLSIRNLHDFIDDNPLDSGVEGNAKENIHEHTQTTQTLKLKVEQHSTYSFSARKTPMAVLQFFTACSGDMDHVKDAVTKVYSKTVRNQYADDYDGIVCGHDCHDGLNTFDEEEDIRVRRLASWNTQGTIEQIDTIDSLENSMTQQMDDSGYSVESKKGKYARATKTKDKKYSRRRVVSFEYPPVTSMRQCPRLDREQLPELFFTQEELEDYEADRECTYNTDDIEIVAISHSLSDGDKQNHAGAVDTRPSQLMRAQNTDRYSESYAPLRRSGKVGKTNCNSSVKLGEPVSVTKTRSGSMFSSVIQNPLLLSRRRSGGKPPLCQVPSTQVDSSTEQLSPRLMKSVQIFLRERSTGK
jgi:hypothetical protein